jgi:hypothetical protein
MCYVLLYFILFRFFQTAFKEAVCNLSRSQINELPSELRSELTFPNGLLKLVSFLLFLNIVGIAYVHSTLQDLQTTRFNAMRFKVMQVF